MKRIFIAFVLNAVLFFGIRGLTVGVSVHKMISVRVINFCLSLTCFIGLGLCIYTYAIELVVEGNENYVAMCDISENISCTKAFKSKYGKGFGIIGPILGEDSFMNKSNALLGIFFYSLSIILVQSTSRAIVRVAYVNSILSCLSSIYFACILYFVLYNLCIVCVSIYVINFVTLALNNYKLKLLSIKKLDTKKKVK